MWMFILLMSSLFLAGISTGTIVTGHRGQPVQIKCPYESGYETNTKYLCRGECSTLPLLSKDIPVRSGSAKDQRFSLDDDTAARVFTITITDLRTEDEGTYWCGIQRPLLPDIYTEVLLLVKLDQPTSTTVFLSTNSPSSAQTQTESTPPFSSTGHPDVSDQRSTSFHPTSTARTPEHAKSINTDSIIYICSGLAIMVIFLLVAMTALLRQRRNTKSPKAESIPLPTMPANHGEDDVIYQEIDDEEPKSGMESIVNSFYSTVEGPIYSAIDEPTTLTIYSTATLPQQSPNNPTNNSADPTAYSISTHPQ